MLAFILVSKVLAQRTLIIPFKSEFLTKFSENDLLIDPMRYVSAYLSPYLFPSFLV